jgi:hypothetical protein
METLSRMAGLRGRGARNFYFLERLWQDLSFSGRNLAFSKGSRIPAPCLCDDKLRGNATEGRFNRSFTHAAGSPLLKIKAAGD